MPGCIDIHDLSFSYSDNENNWIFSNIGFSLDSGEVFCLLGPNGSGKSTLLKCISRLLMPATGWVEIDGDNISEFSAKKIAEKIGFVPQSLVSTFPFNVEDIVVTGRASRISTISSPGPKDRDRAYDAMARIGIVHLAKRPCTRLSGGEWQMVLIARALTQSPKVLLLDEPTSHLDLGNQIKILEVVDTLSKQGVTILMASHSPNHAFLTANKVGILNNGNLAVLGDPDTVLTEAVLKTTYGIPIKVVKGLEGIQRKFCVSLLEREKAEVDKGENTGMYLESNLG